MLRPEVDTASAEFEYTKNRFRRSSAIDSATPKEHHQQQVAQAQAEAVGTYSKAMKRFNDYLLYGNVPDDLRDRT